MADIQETARRYDAGDIYNMDETGFRWRTVPEISQGTAQHKGGKKDMARITAVMCCNATGTDRMPIWYIGQAAQPTCFRTARIRGLDCLGAKWRSNPTVWVDHSIVVEWLRWSDNRVNRRVLCSWITSLLMSLLFGFFKRQMGFNLLL